MIKNYITINGNTVEISNEQLTKIYEILNISPDCYNNKVKKVNRSSSITEEREIEICNLFGEYHINDIEKITGLTRSQIYRIKNKYRLQLTEKQLKRYSPEANARLGETNYNSYNTQMKIIDYQNANNVVVEFQDKWKTRVHTRYKCFKDGNVSNPYDAKVCGVGITGDIYPTTLNGKLTKEYNAWEGILHRSFDKKLKEEHPTYKDVSCCEEWLFYPNFYEWLHKQENFQKWLDGARWAVDKDIIIKGNKTYGPEFCCLVPMEINTLFASQTKGDSSYIGVCKNHNKFIASSCGFGYRTNRYIGSYDTEFDAFVAYKQYKESLIKRIAQDEYSNGNITKRCYDAMMAYKVEITEVSHVD